MMVIISCNGVSQERKSKVDSRYSVEKTDQEWKNELGNVEWDTELLHRHLVLGNDLDNVDGTFSCVRYTKDNLYLFRNEISPLFYDEDMNISSTKFDNSLETESGVMYQMNLVNNSLELINRFETKENPYYFG